MAASRCVTSLLKLSSITCSNLTCRQFHRLVVAAPNNVLCKPKQISNVLPATRLLHLRFYSQKVEKTEESTSKPATSPILGSIQGLGIAGEVFKKQDDSQSSEGQTQSSSSGQQKNSDEEEEAKRKKEAEASWRTMKYTLIFFGVTMSGLTGYIVGTWGAPQKDEEGNVIEDQFSSKPLALQYVLRSWNAIMNYSQMIRDPSRDKLLPDPLKEPYYQPPYTLILEMTGVLVHPDWTYQTGWRFKKRPGIDFFLAQVGPPTFEVVVYTAEQAFTAFPILDALDPNGYIMYRLFRDATRYVDGHHVKDLDCINRDLSKVIVLDWNSQSVKSHPRNALKIKEWKGNDDDRTLIDLALLLKTIATSEVQDVREVLDFYNQFDDPIEAFRENQRKLQEQQELMERMNQEKQTLPATSLARGLFGRRF
ncbi:mitochondrial import inner membrane translocase subunit TIM50-C [Daphnia magna]|uniref:Mitochondrial import inner membrane translocase subunit TIM50 n=1 Tax=Daphnia magna TaxID=35525 RepID=A0ABQ9Z845_9CRUS|nr:mitochondrial import inner membrane translocase subunit TIM50-C [Daphnia magna]KAK4009062.1 hypothetical protein OUZ56_014202 [Daphnia magna]